MSTRLRAWGRLAKCSDAVGSVSCIVDDTWLFLASLKRRYGDELPRLRALLVTVNAYAIIFFFLTPAVTSKTLDAFLSAQTLHHAVVYNGNILKPKKYQRIAFFFILKKSYALKLFSLKLMRFTYTGIA